MILILVIFIFELLFKIEINLEFDFDIFKFFAFFKQFFVVIFFFVGYACFFSIYMIKGITPLQDEVIKTLTSKFKDVNITTIEKSLIVEKEKPKDEKVNDGKEPNEKIRKNI